jgi:Flp pilus assembly protein CpaB
MRINKTLLFVGIALALVAVLGLFFAGRLLNPSPIEVPVAIDTISAGTAVEHADFRLEAWTGVDPRTLDRLFLPANFPAGAEVIVDVPAGSPLYKAYVDTESLPDYSTRLTNLVKETDRVLMALPVTPDMGGNIPKPGDQVDLVISIGTIRVEQVQSHPTPTPRPPAFGRPATTTDTLRTREVATETLPLPLSALVLENVEVLQIDRERITTSSSSYSVDDEEPVVVLGDTERLYVAVTREQAETLAFLLHNGEVLLAVHQAGLGEHYPGGLTWEDFEILFFERRPERNGG